MARIKAHWILAAALSAHCAVLPVSTLAGPAEFAEPPIELADVYAAGTVMARFGLSYLDPDDDTGKWRFNRERFPNLDGLRFQIDAKATWSATLGYMPIDHFSVEIGYIGESEHDLDLRGLMSPFESDRIGAGSIDRQTGFLMLNWFPVCTESWVQPYVGLGAHYTDFDNVTLGAGVDEYLSIVDDAIGPARLFVGDDWGWGLQVGIDILYGRDSNWLFNVAVQYLDNEFTADLHYPIPGEFEAPVIINAARTQLEFDPWIYSLRIGYKF